MTLTVRLDPDLEKKFNAAVRRKRRTKAEVVTQLLTRYVDARESKSAQRSATASSMIGGARPRTIANRDSTEIHRAATQKREQRF